MAKTNWKYTLNGLALGTIGGLAGLSLYAGIAYEHSVKEQKSIHNNPETSTQECVDNVVRQTLDDITVGGVVYAEDRYEDYDQYGDYMHYRDRGMSEVTSVAVYDDDSQIIVRTDKAPSIVPPSRMGDNIADAFNVATYISIGQGNDYIHIDRKASDTTAEKHEKIIRGAQACFR